PCRAEGTRIRSEASSSVRGGGGAPPQVMNVLQVLADFSKHVVEHVRRELSGVRVLPAGMIRPDECLPVGQAANAAMSERGSRLDRHAAMLQQLQVGLKGDLPERDDDAEVRERVDLGVEMGPAAADLAWCWLVPWRRAPHGRRDEHIAQCQA